MISTSQIQVGTAAEHLVIADLLLDGHQAFLTTAGAAYDVVVDIGGQLSTIQVKATRRVSEWRKKAKTKAYLFTVRQMRRGRKPSADIYAFVALDTRTIAYLRRDEILSRDGVSAVKVIEFRTSEAAAASRRTLFPSGKVRQYDVRIITDYPLSRIL